MIYNRKALKADAKGLIARERFDLLWKTALFLVIIATVSQLSTRVTGMDVYEQKVVEAAQALGESVTSYDQEAAVQEFMETVLAVPTSTVTGSFVAFLLSLATAFLMAGYRWWCLLVVRRQENDFRNIFDGFNFPLKFIGLTMLQGLVTICGFVLLVIPGIILLFSYSQSTFILFENPEKGIVQCMRESRQLMRGNKGKLFMLGLSFIGWAILASLIGDAIGSLFNMVGLGFLAAYSGVFFGMWYNTYTGLTYAGFYNYLTGYVPTEPAAEEYTITEDDDDNSF